MSGTVYVTMPYQLFEHDHELTCLDCDRPVRQGQPYVSRQYGFHEDGTPLCELVCAYCGTPPTD